MITLTQQTHVNKYIVDTSKITLCLSTNIYMLI